MRLSWIILGVFLVGLVNPITAQDDIEDDEDVMLEDDIEEPIEGEEAVPELKLERPEYKLPKAKGFAHFAEPFESEETFGKRWVKSKAKKEDGDEAIAKYDGMWTVEEATDSPLVGDLGLILKSRAKHHAISAKLDKPYEFKGKPFVAQYEVKFQNGQECGGAYVKLLSQTGKRDLGAFFDKTPYTIMFGPDKCGNDQKLHFIFRHKNPVNGEFEEKHAKKPTKPIDAFFSDKKTHLFTLVIMPDNTWEIYVDQDLVNSGSLLEDMNPPVNPPEEIVDPEDKKPEDWDEREKIPDPDAEKPEDWDESEPEMIPDEDAAMPDGWLEEEDELVPDPDADKPADWDEDMDGEWEPPMISNPKCEDAPGCGEWKAPQIKNPKYKGKWRAPMVDNPNYKGKWKPRKIANPDFFTDNEPYAMTTIDAVGLELWSMSDEIMFDNFIITDDKVVADEWAADTWELKRVQELAESGSGRSVVDAVLDATNERPWLWAVFIVVVVLPIVLIIVYCCMPGGSKSDDEPARRKKTDEPVADEPADEPSEDDDTQNTETTDDVPEKPAPAAQKKSKKASKADLEEKAEEQSGDGDAEDEGDGDKPAADKSSPRKRKTRARRD